MSWSVLTGCACSIQKVSRAERKLSRVATAASSQCSRAYRWYGEAAGGDGRLLRLSGACGCLQAAAHCQQPARQYTEGSCLQGQGWHLTLCHSPGSRTAGFVQRRCWRLSEGSS